jgi:hypothetical protein
MSFGRDVAGALAAEVFAVIAVVAVVACVCGGVLGFIASRVFS